MLAKNCAHPPDKHVQAKYEPTRWFCGVCYVCVSYLEPVRRIVETNDRYRGSPRTQMRQRAWDK